MQKIILIILLILPLFTYGEEKRDWPFDQAKNVAALTTSAVMKDKKPILHVIHYSEDDSWAFLCGTSDDFILVTMEQVIKTDPSLKTIADLPLGWSAHRASVHHEWVRTKGE